MTNDMDVSGTKSRGKEVVFLRVVTIILFLVTLAVCAALIVLIVTKEKCAGGQKPIKGTDQPDTTSKIQSTIKTTKQAYTVRPTTVRPTTSPRDKHKHPQVPCSEGLKATLPAPRNPSIFQELSEDELISVKNFLMSVSELNLEPEADAIELRVNYIVYMDLHLPAKAEALAYLDGNAYKPTRLARVAIALGRADPPVIREYIVGNLPDASWYKENANQAYNKYPIPYNRRQLTTLEHKRVDGYLTNQAENILKPLLLESYKTSFKNCGKKCLIFRNSYADSTQGTDRTYWFYVLHNTVSFYLHYVGLYLYVNMSSYDITTWRWSRAYYNGKFYDSLEELMNKYNSKTLELIDYPYPEEDPVFSDMKRHKDDDKYSVPKPGPRLVEPEGRRYKVTGRHVEYRGWSFDFGVDVIHGPRLYDIQFRDERVIYELAVQEACVFYAGNNPVSWTAFYYDTSEKLGGSLSRLSRGIDCPETAVYVDYVMYTSKLVKVKRAACVFEHNGGIPIRRHYADNYDGTYSFYGGMTDHYLIVRSIGSFYNYDYFFDMIFRINGVIQVRMTATGYPQIAYAHKDEKPKGGLMHKFALASFHQHLYNVKVDFDIVGTKNRFATYDFGTETYTVPGYSGTIHQLKYEKHDKKTEKDAAMKYEFRKPKYYVIYNNNTENAVGMKRAYRVHNEAKTPLLLDEDSHAFAAAWARYQLATTVHHDDERFSSHHHNSMSSKDPIVTLQKYLDNNENIIDEDLVMWITLGTHHLPSAEDLPVTPTTGNQFSVYLKPFNFFDECPSMQSRDSIYVDATDGTPKQDFHGINRNLTCIPEHVPYGMDTVPFATDTEY